MEPKVTSYAGLLDQSGFKQWYKYQKLRAAHRYDAEDVSFLMSKPSFYFRDYEMMETGAKLTCEDDAVLSEIFCGQYVEILDFDKDDFGIFEKRIIRIRRTESLTTIDYLVSTPWRLNGKSKAAKFKIQQEKGVIMSREEEADLLQQVSFILDKLSSAGFFRCGRAGLEIYQEVEARVRWSPCLRPRYVKQVLYQQLSAGRLYLKANHGQLRFQEAQLNPIRNSTGNVPVYSL
ncbi:hypothetical protein [Parapedobacter sp. 2B3]|uniref:hypothetical protein n=1 Tax=Parapedobacter sp. 2B3 TaxID=3342381 RepID=UPI0035B6906C